MLLKPIVSYLTLFVCNLLVKDSCIDPEKKIRRSLAIINREVANYNLAFHIGKGLLFQPSNKKYTLS